MTTDTRSEESAQVVGRVSSPSSNLELTLDLDGEVEQRGLVGALVGLTWQQSGALETEANLTAVLGQITSIEMRNRWHEDQTFKNIVKSKGKLPAITKLQDTRTALMKVGGCFVQVFEAQPDGERKERYIHGDLGSVPATGTDVNLVRPQFLDRMLESCKDDLFYLGKDYAGNIDFPMWFKHFGKGGGGVGEAYHTGIFGKTGSGKTGLAKMLLAAYGRHRDMGILVIDPQGEFSLEASGNEVGEQGLDLQELLEDEIGREVRTVSVEDLQLDNWGLLEELLTESRFFERVLLVRGSDNVGVARNKLMSFLRGRNIDGLNNRRSAESALDYLASVAQDVYRSGGLADRFKEELDDMKGESGNGRRFRQAWGSIMSMFEGGRGKVKIGGLVSGLVGGYSVSKPIIVLNLAGGQKDARYAEALQKRIISHVANLIVEESAKTLGSEETANALVLLDEAHRFAPARIGEGASDGDRMLRDELKRAVRETRKYGVGWMFISQTMQGLDRELLMQLRTMFFGYGLAFGLEYQRLRELAGGDEDAMGLYRSFRDPHSAMDSTSKQFPFMAIGPVSPMPFSGQPLFFSAFKGDEFRRANGL